ASIISLPFLSQNSNILPNACWINGSINSITLLIVSQTEVNTPFTVSKTDVNTVTIVSSICSPYSDHISDINSHVSAKNSIIQLNTSCMTSHTIVRVPSLLS